MASAHWSTAKVRLSDSAILAGTISLLYAFALMIWPRAFPEAIKRIFDSGHFYSTLALLLVITNEILFVFIYTRRAQKPYPLTFVYIAFLSVASVFVLKGLLIFADVEAHLVHFHAGTPLRHALNSEEILFYTHLGIVSGIFVPYLLIRMTQDYISGADSAGSDVKVQHATAGE